MPQILVKPSDIQGNQFRLSGDEAHHVVHVLRKKISDVIQLFDGNGKQYKARLASIQLSPLSVQGTLIDETKSSDEKVRICLFQGIPKGSKMDFVLEKATELGVHEIQPFLSSKSVIRLSNEQAASKAARWQRVVKAAAKQCGRSTVPDVAEPKKLVDLEPKLEPGLTLVLDQNPNGPTLKEILAPYVSTASVMINIVVGPESGFSSDEKKRLAAIGAIFLSLGSLTLRTESAGLVAVSLIRYELGDLR